jgi:hypothetical protein
MCYRSNIYHTLFQQAIGIRLLKIIMTVYLSECTSVRLYVIFFNSFRSAF